MANPLFGFLRLPISRLVATLACAAVMSSFACAVQAQQPGTSREAFFKPAQAPPAEYSVEALYPQGRWFPLSLFSTGGDRYITGGREPQEESARQAWFKRIKADGFTMLGPQYELNDRILRDAHEHGLKAAITIRAQDAQGKPLKKNALKDADPAMVKEQILKQVRDALASPYADSIGWWYVAPEELRYWRKHEIEFLKMACETIRQTDPQRRPVWMYDPGHRNAAALARTAEFLDVVGKGLYTNYAGVYDQRVWVRWSIEQQNEAIAKARPTAVSIAVPEMFRHPGQYVQAMAKDEQAAVEAIRRWVRHDAYASFIAGAKGMVVFSLRMRDGHPEKGHLPFEGAIHEAYYTSYAKVAGELTGKLKLGDVLLFGERRNDVPMQIVEGPAKLTLKFRNNPEVFYDSVSLANIAWGRDRYLLLANSAEEAVAVMLSDLPYGDDIRVTELFTGHAFPLAEGELQVQLPALGVQVLRIAAP